MLTILCKTKDICISAHSDFIANNLANIYMLPNIESGSNKNEILIPNIIPRRHTFDNTNS